MTNWPLVHLDEALLSEWRGRYTYRLRQRLTWSSRVALSTRLHHLVARKRAEAEAHKWGQLEGEAARKVHDYAAKLTKLRPKPVGPQGEGWSVPTTTFNPYRRKIANWVVRELLWAHEHGWSGVVTSGLRTYSEQAHLYWLYQHGGNIAARPGSSNHEGYVYPRGAIDTPGATQLNEVLNRKPDRKLLWAETHGLADFVHFSGTGR